MRQTSGEKLFGYFNYALLALLAFGTLYPLLYVFSASISQPDAVITGKVILTPIGLDLSAYKEIFNQKEIWVAYLNTIFYTVAGTAVSLVVTILGAYPLSKRRLMGRTFISFMVAFTMWFHAGTIPVYLNLKNLNLIDNRLTMIIAFACSAFYVFLLKTYFQSVPDALEESAKIDGANDFIILYKIFLPLCLPALATIGIYYAVSKWNAFFWAMILLKDESKIPLQVLLRKLIIQMDAKVEGDYVSYTKETFIYATIVISILPILCVYPFIQKYFTKGIMLGSIKE